MFYNYNNNKMKTSSIILQNVKNDYEKTHKKAETGKLLKSVVVILLLSYMAFLTSCLVFVPFRGHGDREHHDNGRHRGNH